MQYITKVFQTKIKNNKAFSACVLEVKDNIDPDTIKNVYDKNVTKVLWESETTTHKGISVRSKYWKHYAQASCICKDYNYIVANGGQTGEDALLHYGRHMPQTRERVRELSGRGFLFVQGNNPTLDKTTKWGAFEVIRVAQVNHKVHGYSTKTLWAIKPLISPLYMKKTRQAEIEQHLQDNVIPPPKYRIEWNYEKVYEWDKVAQSYVFLCTFHQIGAHRGNKFTKIINKIKKWEIDEN